MTQTERNAEAYLRPDGFYLCALSMTTSGVLLASPPFLKAQVACSNGELGALIRRCLEASQFGAPMPPREAMGTVLRPMFELAGVSFGTFMKDARCVQVRLTQEGGMFLTPLQNLGVRNGFVELLDLERIIDASTDDALGKELRAGLADAKI